MLKQLLLVITLVCLSKAQNAGIKATLRPNQITNLQNAWYPFFVNLILSEPINNYTRQNYNLTNANITTFNLSASDINTTLSNDTIYVTASNVVLNANMDVQRGSDFYPNASLTSSTDTILVKLSSYTGNNSNVIFYLQNITLTLNNLIVQLAETNLRQSPDRGLLIAANNLILRHFLNTINSELKNISLIGPNTIEIPGTPLSWNSTLVQLPYIDPQRLTAFIDGSFFVTNDSSLHSPIINTFPDWDENAIQGFQLLIGDDVLNSALYAYWASNSLALNIGNLENFQPAQNVTLNAPPSDASALVGQTRVRNWSGSYSFNYSIILSNGTIITQSGSGNLPSQSSNNNNTNQSSAEPTPNVVNATDNNVTSTVEAEPVPNNSTNSNQTSENNQSNNDTTNSNTTQAGQAQLPAAPYLLVPPVNLTSDLLDAVIPGLASTYGSGRPVVLNCYYDDIIQPSLRSTPGAIGGEFNGTCRVFVQNDQGWEQAIIIRGIGNISASVFVVNSQTIQYTINVKNVHDLRVEESKISNLDPQILEQNINNLLLSGSPIATSITLPFSSYANLTNPAVIIQQGYIEILGDLQFLPLSL